MEVAETQVRGGAMATEGVEVATADEHNLRHAESGGAAGHRPYVVPFRHVVHHHQALRPLRLRRRHGVAGEQRVRTATATATTAWETERQKIQSKRDFPPSSPVWPSEFSIPEFNWLSKISVKFIFKKVLSSKLLIC